MQLLRRAVSPSGPAQVLPAAGPRPQVQAAAAPRREQTGVMEREDTAAEAKERQPASEPKGWFARVVENSGLRSQVTLEDFLGDRSERTDKPGPVGPVTWPSEKWTELWKVFFKPAMGYTDRFGVAWPMSRCPKDDRTEAQRAEAREKAARDLVNIDNAERSMRVKFGSALLGLTAAVVLAMVKLDASPLERLYAVPLFFLGAAEIASGTLGL